MTTRQSLDIRLRRHLGLIVELDLFPATPDQDSTTGQNVFRSHNSLAVGWYMLTVSADSQWMGAGLELLLENHRAGIQLGVTGLSRRIVYNASPLTEVSIALDSDSASQNSTQGIDLHISLSRLSRRFARRRMEKKCHREVTYESYDKFMCAYRNKPDYMEWLSRHPDRGVATLPDSEESDEVDALVFAPDDVILHERTKSILLAQLYENPRIQLCYCDHDVIDTRAEPLHGVMKPSWDVTLLQSGNYIGRVFACTKALHDKLGGLDNSLDDSKEYDFLLRASHELAVDEVQRVPAILYSVHESSGSDPWFSTGKKDQQALEQYWLSRVPDKTLRPRIVNASVSGLYQTHWPLPDPAPSVDIIIPTRDRTPLLRACVESTLRLTDYPNFHIRVVDNDSEEAAFFAFQRSLEDDSRVSFMPVAGEFNYSAINNAAVYASSADIVVLLNNDTEIVDGRWLDELVGIARQSSSGCVGARLLYANSRVQHAGIVMGMKGLAGHVNRFATDRDSGYLHKLCIAHQTSAVTAACLAIRREVFINCGGLDEKDLKVAFNDVDLCLRVAAHGYDNILAPYVTLLHHESVSRGADDSKEKAARFRQECETMHKRWSLVIADDPHWNPNLSLDSEKPIYAAE